MDSLVHALENCLCVRCNTNTSYNSLTLAPQCIAFTSHIHREHTVSITNLMNNCWSSQGFLYCAYRLQFLQCDWSMKISLQNVINANEGRIIFNYQTLSSWVGLGTRLVSIWHYFKLSSHPKSNRSFSVSVSLTVIAQGSWALFLACKLVSSSQLCIQQAMKPKESAKCHQSLSLWVGSGDMTIRLKHNLLTMHMGNKNFVALTFTNGSWLAINSSWKLYTNHTVCTMTEQKGITISPYQCYRCDWKQPTTRPGSENHNRYKSIGTDNKQ